MCVAHCIQQPYMLAAIKEMANYKDEVTRSCHLETAEYLEACNKLFKNGILSHDMIKSSTSPVLENMRQGFAYFEQWHHDLSQSDTGKSIRTSIPFMNNSLPVILMMTEVKLRSPLQKDFLAWQVSTCIKLLFTSVSSVDLIT